MLIIVAFLLGALTFAAADYYREWKKINLELVRRRGLIEQKFEEFVNTNEHT